MLRSRSADTFQLCTETCETVKYTRNCRWNAPRQCVTLRDDGRQHRGFGDVCYVLCGVSVCGVVSLNCGHFCAALCTSDVCKDCRDETKTAADTTETFSLYAKTKGAVRQIRT